MPPGQEGAITLKVDTSNIRGEVSKTARVFSNDSTNSTVILTIKGTIKHIVDVIPHQVNIRGTRGGPVEGKVMLVNNDRSPLQILGVEIDNHDFTPSLHTLEKGKRYEVLIKLDPKAAGGRFGALLKVRTNKEKSRDLVIPVNATVTARVEAAPDRLDFRQIELEAVKNDPRLQYRMNRWFTVRGQDPGFKITRVESSLPFVHTEIIPPKQAGQSYRIKVTLAENKLKKGAFNGAIIVRTNDREFAELKIPLSGEVL